MPTYDYRCDACGHTLEIFHSMTAAPKRKCPACGQLKLKRAIGSGAGIIFKGSGFYETDYRSDSYKKGAATDKPSSDESRPAVDENRPAVDENRPAAKDATAKDASEASKPASKDTKKGGEGSASKSA